MIRSCCISTSAGPRREQSASAGLATNSRLIWRLATTERATSSAASPKASPSTGTPISLKKPLNRTTFLVALDPSGAPVWSSLGTGMDFSASAVAACVTDSRVWVGGNAGTPTKTTLKVQAFDKTGQETFSLWPREQSGDSFVANIIATHDRRGVVLLGRRTAAFMLNGAPIAAPPTPNSWGFLLALAEDGAPLWTLDLPERSQPQHAAFDNVGNLYVTALFWDQTTIGGTEVNAKGGRGLLLAYGPDRAIRWWKQLSHRDQFRSSGGTIKQPHLDEVWPNGILVDVDSAGDVALFAGFSQTMQLFGATVTGSSLRDAILVKLAPDGGERWRKLVQGPGQLPHALAVDGQGLIWTGGSFVDRADGYLGAFGP